MKDDLISRNAAIEAIVSDSIYETRKAIAEAIRKSYKKSDEWLDGIDDAISAIEGMNAVPAVPLDKLCKWLNVHCGRPNDCNDRLCGKCQLDGEGFEYETCWETLLTKWMEGQDEAD